MSPRLVLGFSLASIALAGCAGQAEATRVGPAELTSLYTSQTLAYAAQGGELRTEFRGYPFTQQGIAPETIAGAMKSPSWHRKFRFTTQPNPKTETNYRLIVRFNPPVGGPQGEKICAGEEPGGFGNPGGPLVAHGILCVGDRLSSEVRAYDGQVSSPADPRFQATINAMLAEMMPPENPRIERNGGCRGPMC